MAAGLYVLHSPLGTDVGIVRLPATLLACGGATQLVKARYIRATAPGCNGGPTRT